METPENSTKQSSQTVSTSFFERVWDESWTYIKTIVDVVREPVLILDKHLHVMAANESFYNMFHVEPNDTEGKEVYELGNGQWDIPALRQLLEDILPHNSFFKGFEVTHEFPVIGRKIMILNARQIHFQENVAQEFVPPIILLAMEDVTDMMAVGETLASHAKNLETTFSGQIEKMETHIGALEKEIAKLKQKL